MVLKIYRRISKQAGDTVRIKQTVVNTGQFTLCGDLKKPLWLLFAQADLTEIWHFNCQ